MNRHDVGILMLQLFGVVLFILVVMIPFMLKYAQSGK